MNIINLTRYTANENQKSAGAFDLSGEDHDALISMLTFTALPSAREIEERAIAIAKLASKYKPDMAMIGGAPACGEPFLMSTLERELRNERITPVYPFSIMVRFEEKDGMVPQPSFMHLGFVNPRV